MSIKYLVRLSINTIVDFFRLPDINVNLFLDDEQVVDLLLEERDQLGQLLNVGVQFVRLPNQTDALGDQVLNLLSQVRHLVK
jgi:hypothetical protein